MTQRMHEENAAFPLSQSQQNIWDLEKAYSGTSINHITTSVWIQGQFRLDLLQKSIRLLLESDSSLRTRIEMREGKLVQYIVPMEEEAVPVFDFSLSGQDGVENWAQALAREPMPVLGGALCRFWLFKTGENDGGILMKLHHLISDGWSQVLLCNKLQKIYLDLLEGRTVQLPPAPEYRLHVSEEQQYLQSAAAMLDGRTVVLPREEEEESPQKLADLIRSFGVGFLSLPPSRLSAFLQQPDFARAVSGLRSIICGGEAFPADLLHRLQQLPELR